MRAFLVVTLSAARLHPIARVWYAEDGFAAVHDALRAHPDEILYQPVKESPVAGVRV